MDVLSTQVAPPSSVTSTTRGAPTNTQRRVLGQLITIKKEGLCVDIADAPGCAAIIAQQHIAKVADRDAMFDTWASNPRKVHPQP
jgi:hypothetical protein